LPGRRLEFFTPALLLRGEKPPSGAVGALRGVYSSHSLGAPYGSSSLKAHLNKFFGRNNLHE